MTKKALITGIAGQDGSYLAELLLDKGYEVYGTVRRNSTPEHQISRIDDISANVQTHYADLTDVSSMTRLVKQIQPDVVFNLAAQSHVRVSFEIPSYTSQVNAEGALNLFEIIRTESPGSKIYQASSSEMFGTNVDADGYQRESTSMLPASPYGCAKLFAFHAARTYRDSYGLHLSNGILFNHESPRRGSNFVTTKIIRGAIQIKNKVSHELMLGNIESSRDWGHSKDYVAAMLAITEQDQADDYVIATGETRSIKDLCELVFSSLNLEWQEYVKFDARLLRPKEVPMLKGDSSKARKLLGWEPKISFEEMISEMITFWDEKESQSMR
jgi:GDPmannose 4,6-dehydratase